MSNSNTVKDILLREKLLDYKCKICGNIGEWNNKPLSLQLHHKDGHRTNNDISNLEFLCLNCHSQTDNYGYKNAERKEKEKYFCQQCGGEISKNTRTGLCKICANKKVFYKRNARKRIFNIYN